jgi:hypothetical protein
MTDHDRPIPPTHYATEIRDLLNRIRHLEGELAIMRRALEVGSTMWDIDSVDDVVKMWIEQATKELESEAGND